MDNMDDKNRDTDISEMSDTEVIEKYQKLVSGIAYHYINTGVPIEDLNQEGMIGLLEAKKRFKTDKGASFTTYAIYWIKNRILSLIRREYKLGHCSEYIDEMNQDMTNPVELEYQKSTRNHSLDLPDDMPDLEKKVITLSFADKKSLTEISEMLNISREKIRQIKTMAMRRYKSLKNITKA